MVFHFKPIPRNWLPKVKTNISSWHALRKSSRQIAQELQNSILWSDESKSELYGSHRRQYIRTCVEEKFTHQCLVPTIKHGGGSLNVWGCISSQGVGDLYIIDGILNAQRYKSIVQRYSIPSGLRLIGQNFIFQQDNDPKHTAVCKYWHCKGVSWAKTRYWSVGSWKWSTD